MDPAQLSTGIWKTLNAWCPAYGPRVIEVPDGLGLSEVTEMMHTWYLGRTRHLVTAGAAAPWLTKRNGGPVVDALHTSGRSPWTVVGWDHFSQWFGVAELSEHGPVVVVIAEREGPPLSDLPPNASWARKLAYVTGWDHEPAMKNDPVDWAAAEKALGTRLPSDYKEIVDLLGNGGLDRDVDLLTPGIRGMDLVDWARRSKPGDYHPYPTFPAPGGLLRWGTSEQELDFVWRTGAGDPDDWPVMVGEFGDWEEYEYGVGEFLAGSLTGPHHGTHTWTHFDGY